MYVNPQTYTQIHTPIVVQGWGGGGCNPSLEFLICCSILKRFDVLNKMRCILGVVALLGPVTSLTMVAILDFTKN